jgi:hypothetical protein
MPSIPPGPSVTPAIDVRREVALALVAPAVMTAATIAALWLALFTGATASAAVDAAFVVAVVLAALGAVAVVVTAVLGRLRQVMQRLTFVAPLLTLLAVTGFVYAFDQFALAHRGVAVGCEVVAKDDYVRGSGSQRTDHEFRCPGWPSFHEDTRSEEQFPLGHDAIVTIDPDGRAGPALGEVSWSGGLFSAAFATALLAAIVVGRLHAVDDGSIKAAARRRLTALPVLRRAPGGPRR